MHAQLPAQGIEDEPEGITRMMIMIKGVTGGPSGPSREGPGVGHKIVSDTKQMTKGKKKEKKRVGKKEKMCKKKKKKEEREREKCTEINGKRYRNAPGHGQRQKYRFER